MIKPTLVLGASLKPTRYSYKAILRLKSSGYAIKAIGLRDGLVAEVKIIPFKKALEDSQFFNKKIHTITLYLNPTRQQAYYDFILKVAPKRVIFNPGTENPALYVLLERNNIEVEIACTLVLLATNQY